MTLKREKWELAKNEECVVCGSPFVEIHHVFYGTANRKLSDEYGYVVPLCQRHHTGPDGVHFNRTLDLRFKKAAQADYESRFGNRKDFIRLFGRNYE